MLKSKWYDRMDEWTVVEGASGVRIDWHKKGARGRRNIDAGLNQATKSSGRLNPPLRFMYCRYLRFRITCTSPASLPSTFLFLVVSKPQKPMAFIISCSSGDLPSRSAADTTGRWVPPPFRDFDVDALCRSRSNDRDLKTDCQLVIQQSRFCTTTLSYVAYMSRTRLWNGMARTCATTTKWIVN